MALFVFAMNIIDTTNILVHKIIELSSSYDNIYNNMFELIVTSFISFFSISGAIFSVIVSFIALITTVCIVAQALASRAFGWTGFLDGLFLDMAVEPVPFGAHPLEHIPWNAVPGTAAYTHSWSYEDPAALKRVQGWTATLLAEKQRANTTVHMAPTSQLLR